MKEVMTNINMKLNSTKSESKSSLAPNVANRV